jgi:N-acetylglucosaminyldiphosphoundecaprenol N-acetyl-beta-D-mannosaminyltransferase
MGTPYQEDFALLAKKFLKSSFIITCGGFLTQTSIRPDYYSPLVKRLGLRWLQRAIYHKHVRRRLIVDYPKFMIRYIVGKLRG